MKQEVFNIKSLPDFEFRIKKISPVDLLCLTTTMDLEDFNKTQDSYNFILEHTEVKINDKWFPVKIQGKDIYMPESLEENLIALNELIEYFFSNIIAPLFQKSSE